MSRPLVALLLAFSLVVAPPGRTRAEPPVAALLRPPESLRGEPLDEGDPWTLARLLAVFGEDSRALAILCAGYAQGTSDPRSERFEARLLTHMGMYGNADSVLALQPRVASAREYYLHWLQRARLSALSGDYERALGFIGRIDGLEDSVFEPYRDLVAIESLLRVERPLDVCDRAERRLSKGVPVSLIGEFERRLLEAYVDVGRLTDALALIETVKKRNAEEKRLEAVAAREADVRFALGDTLGAVEAAFELAKKGRPSDAAVVVRDVMMRVSAAALRNEVVLGFASVLVKGDRPAEARRLIGVLEGRTLEDPQIEERRLLDAEVLYAEKDYEAAAHELDAPLGESTLERSAKLLRGRIYRAEGNEKSSAEAYEGFAAAYPYDSKAPEALYVAWGLRQESGAASRASELLRQIVETYPSHRYARWAAVRIALDCAARKEYTRATRMLEQTLEKTGRDDPASLYYLADVYGRMGKKERKAKVLEEIAALNPVSFYLDPHIASSFVLPVLPSDSTASPTGSDDFIRFLVKVYNDRMLAEDRIRGVLDPWAWGEGSDSGEAAEHLVRGRAFLQMGFRDWGEAELRAFESRGKLLPRAVLELGVLYDDFAMPWRSVRLYQRVWYTLGDEERRAFERDFDLLMYPVPFPSLVFENCIRHGLSPHLAYGMMREESRFDARAVSAAGAIGLMQIMPETGGQIAEELGYSSGTRTDLFEPEVNIAFGIRYASRLSERSGNDPLMMLAAYNAGFGNARKWFGKENAKKSPAERVDGIEYWETRDYVKRIVESARLYHNFYFSGEVPAAEGLSR